MMFENAQNTLISGGTFTTYTAPASQGREGLGIIRDKIAVGAFHNSAERFDPPKCHPNTREIVLNKIMDWVRDAQKLFLFMWLYGPAGAGKSAIAQTIAEICHAQGLLTASFFFSRNTTNRNNESLLITTIVYQLVISIPEIREQVGKVVELDPLLLSKSLEAQLQALVVDPLNEAAANDQNLTSRPRFIIIDGLDECGEPKIQRYILDILLSSLQQLSVPLFVLVASRPDPHIRDAFNQDLLNSLTTRIVLDDSYQPDADIRTFLLARFDDVKRKHPTLIHRRPPWPSTMDVELLVQKSSGQFIYASTVMKYVDSHQHWPPDRLDIAFGLSITDDDTPLAELDLFYHHILSSVADIDKVLDIFMFILLVQFWDKTRDVIEDFLFFRRGEVDVILCDLHSLVSIPLPDDNSSELRIFHASFPDFLLDRSRSGKFYIDTAQASTKIARYCMRHFKEPDIMCQDGINLHHLRALFMLQAITAQTTDEFLDDICDIDMHAQLSFWASDDNVIGMYEHDNKRIVTFLMWLTSQRHRGTAILQRHLGSIDKWFYSQLETYPHQYLFNLLLAAGTYSDFVSKEIFMILGPDSVAKADTDPDYPRPRRFDPLQIYSPRIEYKPFYTLLSKYLKDPARSQDYHVNENRYTTLSIFVAVFVLQNMANVETSEPGSRVFSIRTSAEARKLACNLLAFTLPRSANLPELAKVLQRYNPRLHSSAQLDEETEKSVDAAFSYLGKFRDRGPKNMRLLIAYRKLKREEPSIPMHAYITWRPQFLHDLGSDFEYDVIY